MQFARQIAARSSPRTHFPAASTGSRDVVLQPALEFILRTTVSHGAGAVHAHRPARAPQLPRPAPRLRAVRDCVRLHHPAGHMRRSRHAYRYSGKPTLRVELAARSTAPARRASPRQQNSRHERRDDSSGPASRGLAITDLSSRRRQQNLCNPTYSTYRLPCQLSGGSLAAFPVSGTTVPRCRKSRVRASTSTSVRAAKAWAGTAR